METFPSWLQPACPWGPLAARALLWRAPWTAVVLPLPAGPRTAKAGLGKATAGAVSQCSLRPARSSSSSGPSPFHASSWACLCRMPACTLSRISSAICCCCLDNWTPPLPKFAPASIVTPGFPAAAMTSWCLSNVLSKYCLMRLWFAEIMARMFLMGYSRKASSSSSSRMAAGLVQCSGLSKRPTSGRTNDRAPCQAPGASNHPCSERARSSRSIGRRSGHCSATSTWPPAPLRLLGPIHTTLRQLNLQHGSENECYRTYAPETMVALSCFLECASDIYDSWTACSVRSSRLRWISP